MAPIFHPTTASFIVFIVALCAESWFSWRFLRGLKRDYSDLWVRSGKRTIWSDGDLVSAFPTIKFLWNREYFPQSRDSEVAFCDGYRLPVVISWAAAVMSVLAFIVSLLIFGWPATAR